MARPSRGFTVNTTAPKTPLACPDFGNTEQGTLLPALWFLSATWAPDVFVPTLTFFFSVNGDPPVVVLVLNDVHSGDSGTVNPRDFATTGDTIDINATASDISGCPDFDTSKITVICT